MKATLTICSLLVLATATTLVVAKSKKSCAPQIGFTAPNFTLPDQHDKPITFHKVMGKKVLYFYPMDRTPGCTKEACSIRDGYKQLQKEGITILGVNYDSPKSHKKFIDKHKLPFSLLSDEDKGVSRLYHTHGWFVPSRVTFLVDEDNKIVDIIKHVQVKDHADQIINAFKDAAKNKPQHMTKKKSKK